MVASLCMGMRESCEANRTHVFEQGKEMTILSGSVETKSGLGGSSLRLVRAGGAYQVTRLDVQALGKSFNFLVPKDKRSKVERAAAESGIAVSISGTP